MSSDWDLLAPDAQANKYSRGKLIVVAGSARYPGAAALAASAGQRMGAGYTEVITAKKALDAVRSASPSLVVKRFSQWDVDAIAQSMPSKPCAVCVGPGFTGAESEADLVMRVLAKARCPVLVDGGALSALGSGKAAKRLAGRAEAHLPTVVTPHGGEAARLARMFGLPMGDASKMAAGLAFALQAVVVLKGPDTYISDGKRTYAMEEGTAALAKAGTGDVLAGMIGALLAQGIDPFEAARIGSTVHARAGALAADELTEVCVIAEDVIRFFPAVLKRMQRQM